MKSSVSTTPTENMAVQVDRDRPAPAGSVRPWRLNIVRAGYLFVLTGIAATQWPMLLNHDPSWPLMEGVKTSMLAAVSILAVLGLRYPLQMLPILLFEVVWKVVWGAAVAWPLWAAGRLDPATRQVASDCLWVVIVLAAIPWRYVLAQYVVKRGERWRTR